MKFFELITVLAIATYLLITDGLRVFRAWERYGDAVGMPVTLAFAVTAALVCAWYLLMFTDWPPLWMNRWLLLPTGLALLLFLIWAFVYTHGIRVMRRLFTAVGEPHTPWEIFIVTYQTFVWAAIIPSVIVFSWAWRRAGRTGSRGGSRSGNADATG